MKKYKPYIYILPAIIFWGSAPAIVKLSLISIDIFQITFLMFLLASIGLFLINLVMGKLNIIKLYTIKDYLHFAFMGFIGIFLYFLFLFNGFFYSSTQEAYIINYTWPLWMIMFTIFIARDKIHLRNILSISISFFGLFIIVTKGNLFSFTSENLIGYIFALFSAICYGLFSAMGKNERRDPINSMFFYFLFSSFYSLFFLLYFSKIPILSLWESTAILWLGICSCALGFLFWFKALRHGKSSELVNFVFLTPFISLFFIYLFIIEQIQTSSILGLFLILIAIFIDKTDNVQFNNSSKVTF
jgi:drug/metabolite transporter (DMT)-like permease